MTRFRAAVAQVRAAPTTSAALDAVEQLEVTRGRFDFDPAGHHGRPDRFTLTGDSCARTPVEHARDPG